MHIEALDNKRVCILGFGLEGRAAARAISSHAPGCVITVADKQQPDKEPEFDGRFGPGYLDDLDAFDVIVKSPGIPMVEQIQRVQTKLTSSTQIFLDTIADTGSTVIGVTGTKGKSTTSSLIYETLKAGGKDAYLIGNMGRPALDHLSLASSTTHFVFELSSYQLSDLSVSPAIAVLVSFFPEHLDYHGSLDAYFNAKRNIVLYQRPSDIVFYNGELDACVRMAESSCGVRTPFSADDAPLAIESTHLRGRHNLSNIAAAFRVGEYLGIDQEACLRAFKEFPGLPHRLQHLGNFHGIEWIDDAISTTPESTIAGIKAVADRLDTIIVGGKDRGLSFDELGVEIARSRIRNVVLLPETGLRVKDAVVNAKPVVGSLEFHEATDMHDAVSFAIQQTQQGRICMLSPAASSYNAYRSYEEKGASFRSNIASFTRTNTHCPGDYHG